MNVLRSLTSSLSNLVNTPPAAAPQARSQNAAVAQNAGVSSFVQTTAPNPNAILSRYTPTGASADTAGADGLPPGLASSRQMAMHDLPNIQKYKADIESVAQQYGFPPALLAGMISRESRGGTALDSTGHGDGGHGYGLMQVDDGTAAGRGGPTSREHLAQGAQILQGKLNEVKAAHPDWAPEQQLRGAVAAYNMGAGNVQTLAGMDVGSWHGDYSNDVWARAQALAPYFGGAATTGTGRPDINPTPNTSDTGAVSSDLDTSGATLLKNGDSGSTVQLLQQKLKQAGFDPGAADGQFGPATEAAVKAFQQAKGLDVDGIAGPKTLAALNAATKPTTGGTGNTTWTPAPSAADVAAGKATLKQGMQGDAVSELQKMLGVEADGKFGQQTSDAVKSFQQSHGLTPPPGMEGQVGKTTWDAIKKEASSGGVVTGNYRVDTNNPTLQKLANGPLENGPTGYCVSTTLDNMKRNGVPQPEATGQDVGNNPRGGMVQLVRDFGWKSLPLPGAQQQTINSPYGSIQANVVPASEYKKLADAGKIPSGAIIFQTRHPTWNMTSENSHGFDMGIVRNGGRSTFNYANMPPLVYGDAQSVVILVPGDALKPAN